MYIYCFLIHFICISYLHIWCTENNHDRLTYHHQHDKSTICRCTVLCNLIRQVTKKTLSRPTPKYITVLEWKHFTKEYTSFKFVSDFCIGSIAFIYYTLTHNQMISSSLLTSYLLEPAWECSDIQSYILHFDIMF